MLRYIFKLFSFFAFLNLIVLNTTFAFQSSPQNFLSIHQKPIIYSEQVKSPSGQISYIQTSPFSGFRDQYSPYGVSGCYIGNPTERERCAYSTGGFSIVFDGYTSDREYKLFIPEGVNYFSLAGYLPQNQQYATVARFDYPPTRLSLSSEEYEYIKRTQNPDLAFGQLLNDNQLEIVMVHDGSGAISIAGTGRLYANPVSKGRWLYVRVLDGGSIYNLRAVYGMNFPIYKSWHDNAVATGLFAANGDPIEGSTPPPVYPPALQNIKLSLNAWTVGSGGAPEFTISANPTNANLGSCTVQNDAFPRDILTIGASSSSTAKVTIDTAKANALAQSHTFVINCDGKTEDFTIVKQTQPADPVARVVGIEEKKDDLGRITLVLQLQHTAAELANGNREVNYWAGGEVPLSMIFPDSPGSVMFFLANRGGLVPVYEWSLLLMGQDPESVALERNRVLRGTSQRLEVPLYLTREELNGLHATVRLGYQVGNDEFKEISLNWTPAP